MSESKSEFSRVQLPAVVLADMYKNYLVSIDDEYIKPAEFIGQPPAEILPEPILPAVDKQQKMVLPPFEQAEIQGSDPGEPASLTDAPHAFLGAFKKHILVLLSDPQAVHINENDLTFLSKILASVGISVEHIALLNTNGKNISYPELKEQFPAKVAIYFGVEPSSIGVPMRFPHFQVQPWDGCTFLFAPSLQVLNGNSPEQTEWKKQLWTALKKIFV